ncbi:MAG TPA: NAD(+) diphosphatase [Candidatus Stackebrandtia faecavium]|nr:NAD(+) diphosphatase [Candidatus Stackebrandtia faecavium]
MHRPQFFRTYLDRAAHNRKDEEWLKEAWERGRVLVVDPETGNVETDGQDPPGLVFRSPDDAPNGIRLYLGGELRPYFAVTATVSEGANLRRLATRLSEFEADIVMEAVALARWHSDHVFHPATGNPTEVSSGGWERRDGEKVIWPRTDPAIMVLITDGADRCLLANGVSWPSDRYSCVAGFVDPGESAEAACHREVLEEVGIDITGLSYVASQPWPFPRSLMLAYSAVGDPDATITMEPEEIADARWFTREQVRDALAGRPAPLQTAQSASIARFLLERWAA